ncbi:hypothetical protein V493_03225 [Pseudogymnoascus sp. VKM F-4281 (FW-2241)]|nr:hypothetical protein V493_03225 [Pseudogymnoascus sp. VKM F-4281 (FW-2241)]
MQKAQEEGIYASFMPASMIVTRLDQGLTLPPKIHPETLPDSGESHKESISKEHATKVSTSEAYDHYLIDHLSHEDAGNNNVDCANETQQEHTGKVYDLRQHIEPNSHRRLEKLTGGPSTFPIQGQKQLGFYSSSLAPHRASKPWLEKPSLENRLAKIELAGCQGGVDEEPANQLQRGPIRGNIPSICPMGGRVMPETSKPSQDTVPQTQKNSDVYFLCNRECITASDQPVATKHLVSLQTDDLPEGGIGERGQELTVSMGSKVERLPKPELSSSSSTPESLNIVDGMATRNVSAPEQLQDEKSQDEKLQYEKLQNKIHTSGQVSVSLVENGTDKASAVSCGVESPKAKGVETRLYNPVYKSPKANASSQVYTTIATTIRNKPASKHISATLQHRSLSSLYSSHPQLIALRSYIATAPLPSPGVRKIQQLILAAIDGEIDMEGTSGLEPPLEAIFHRLQVDEQFRNMVITFAVSKLGNSITENGATSSNQNSPLWGNTSTSKAPGPKFNLKTCTFEELKEEYSANKELAKKEHKQLLKAIPKRIKLEEKVKELEEQLEIYEKISRSVPGTKFAANDKTKWSCTSCGLRNKAWADLTEWAPGKTPKEAKSAPEEGWIPESNKIIWAKTEYCRRCGRYNPVGRSRLNAASPSKRKLADDTEEASSTSFEDEFKRRCKDLESALNASGIAVPITPSFQFQLDLPVADAGAQLPQLPITNQYTANLQQGESNAYDSSAQYLPNISGTVADQLCFPNTNGGVPDQQCVPNGSGTIVGQQYFPVGSDKVTDQQYSSSGNGTISDQQRSLNGSGTITDQQCSSNLTGTSAGQHCLSSTNGSVTNQQYVPDIIGMYTDQFAGERDLFADFDFDALPPIDSQDPFSMANWSDEVPSPNTGAMTSVASETPNATFPYQTASSATPSSIGYSKESPIEIDDVFPISEADLRLIHGIPIEQPYEPTGETSAKPQSNTKGKHAKPGVKYDMRGNQIGPSILPTVKYHKPMAPRTAKVGALMFPASAAPKNAAPQNTQHPNGG